MSRFFFIEGWLAKLADLISYISQILTCHTAKSPSIFFLKVRTKSVVSWRLEKVRQSWKHSIKLASCAFCENASGLSLIVFELISSPRLAMRSLTSSATSKTMPSYWLILCNAKLYFSIVWWELCSKGLEADLTCTLKNWPLGVLAQRSSPSMSTWLVRISWASSTLCAKSSPTRPVCLLLFKWLGH